MRLRQSYPEFVYRNFTLEQEKANLQIRYNFEISQLVQFQHYLTIPVSSFVEPTKIAQMVFLLGMVEALSYWKATCSPLFIIKAGRLTREQVIFFEHLLRAGLGEFFYKNQIDFRDPDFVRFVNKSQQEFIIPDAPKKASGDLLLVGGGKESALMLDLVNQLDTPKTVMHVNPTPAAQVMTDVAGIKNVIQIVRQIDPQLLKLNQEGFLNGHTPFSASLAFLGILVAQLYGLKNVIVGNEADAEEENLVYLGQNINHQYSKAGDFEKKFQRLIKHLNVPQYYFSLLRPLNELQIAYLFRKMPQYHKVFVSCNRKHGLTWCGECAKCVNSYLVLAAFLPKKDLTKIFMNDFVANPDNSQFLKQIVGLAGQKPFECVAAYSTAQAAVILLLNRHYPNQNLPIHLSEIRRFVDSKMTIFQARKLLENFWNQHHGLPDTYLDIVKKSYEQISDI